jgi:hypothetical protein
MRARARSGVSMTRLGQALPGRSIQAKLRFWAVCTDLPPTPRTLPSLYPLPELRHTHDCARALQTVPGATALDKRSAFEEVRPAAHGIRPQHKA